MLDLELPFLEPDLEFTLDSFTGLETEPVETNPPTKLVRKSTAGQRNTRNRRRIEKVLTIDRLTKHDADALGVENEPAGDRCSDGSHLTEQHERFFSYWTLKEAYIKARGMGLALPLDQFSFHLDEEDPIRISFEPAMKDEPSTWQFALSKPSPTHVLAVGARKLPGRDLAIQIMQTVPLGD